MGRGIVRINKSLNEKAVLLIENDELFASAIKNYFEINYFNILHANNYISALNILKKKTVDLIILNILLPGINGFDILAEMKQINSSIPVIITTDIQSDTESEIKAYESGAINYLEKPFDPRILLTMIKARFNNKHISHINNHIIQLKEQTLLIDSQQLFLNPREYIVIKALLENQNKIVSRKDLLLLIWKSDDYSLNNMLDGIIYNLKKKIKPFEDILIKNVYSKGYYLQLRKKSLYNNN